MPRLLIVDDSATSRAIATGLIGPAYVVVEASSGRQALDLVESGGVDLILLDLLMPGMTGLEVLEELKASRCSIPVVVATADIQESTRTRVIALGAFEMVNKPFRKEALDKALEAALERTARLAAPRLDPLEKDALEELVNIAVGRAANVLNTMLSSHIALRVPSIELVTVDALHARLSLEGADRLSAVEMRCSGGLEAAIELIFATDDAAKLADCIVGQLREGGLDHESMRSGALCEVGNIVINAMLGTIANAFGLALRFSVPSYLEGRCDSLVDEIAMAAREVIILVKTRFEIEDLKIDGDIAIFLTLDSFASLSRMLRGNGGMRG